MRLRVRIPGSTRVDRLDGLETFADLRGGIVAHMHPAVPGDPLAFGLSLDKKTLLDAKGSDALASAGLCNGDLVWIMLDLETETWGPEQGGGSDFKRSRPPRRMPLIQLDGAPAVPEPLRSVVRANAGPAASGPAGKAVTAGSLGGGSPALILAHAALLAAGFRPEGVEGTGAVLPEVQLEGFARRGILRMRYSLVGGHTPASNDDVRPESVSINDGSIPPACAGKDDGPLQATEPSCELVVSRMGPVDLALAQVPGHAPWALQQPRTLPLEPETPTQCRELREAWRQSQDGLAWPSWLAAQRQRYPSQALPCLQDLVPSAVEVVSSFLTGSDLGSLACTCRPMRAALAAPAIWRAVVAREFPRLAPDAAVEGRETYAVLVREKRRQQEEVRDALRERGFALHFGGPLHGGSTWVGRALPGTRHSVTGGDYDRLPGPTLFGLTGRMQGQPGPSMFGSRPSAGFRMF